VSLERPRYAINPSRHEVFSIFLAEALAVGTPAATSREIAENVEARVKPFTKDVVIAENALIKTWSEALLVYVRELYRIWKNHMVL